MSGTRQSTASASDAAREDNVKYDNKSIPCVAAGEGVAFSTLGDWEVGKPPAYFEPLFRPDVAASIEEELDNLSHDLRELSLKIHGE